MPSRRSARQSRLTFTPLPSSSPATKGYNKQIQERAAAVGYDGTPSSAKRRKLQSPGDGSDSNVRDAQLIGTNMDLPTPAATMNLGGDGITEDEDDAGIRSMQRRTKRKSSRQQQQLDFTGGRESSSFDSPVRLASSLRSPRATAGMFSTQSKRVRRKHRATVEISSEDSGAEEPQSATELQDDDGDEPRARPTRSSQRPVVIDSDDSDDEVTVTFDKQQLDCAGDSGDDMPTTQGKQPRQRRRKRSRDSFISSSPPRVIDSDSDLEIIEQPKKRRERHQTTESEQDSDGDVEPVTPRRKLKQQRQMSRREEEDLQEDLDFLGPSSDVEAMERQPRSTQTKQKDARQAALKKLKQKRSGATQPIAEETEEQDEGPSAEQTPDELYDSSDHARVKPSSSRQFFRKDADDEDFIDSAEEGDAPLGAPEGMPIEFTYHAREKPKDLFKYAVEWMVQKKINPAFNMDDELYQLTFRKLDDEVKGLAGSKFTSAAWTPQFTTALKSRPEIAFDSIDRQSSEHWMNDHCDACNRSGHPATFEIQFQGKPYHPETLEEVASRDDDDDDDEAENEDSSSEDNDDQSTYDYRGNQVPPASTSYYVGKFCKANAETAHALQHWRWHLNEWTVAWLTRNGYLTAEKIVRRDQQSTKKRRREADKITDRMEKDGVIKELWREFRKSIDEAYHSKQGRFSAGDD